MTRRQIATVLGWFLLAGYVIFRCFFTAATVDYDILFACWLGGVLSLACWFYIRDRRR